MIFHQPCNSLGNGNFDISVYKNINWQHHFHKNYELIYVYQGSVDCIIGKRQFILNEGEFALCLSNEIHCYSSIGESLSWVCVFSEDIVPRFTSFIKGKTGVESRFVCKREIQKFLDSTLLKDTRPNGFLFESTLYAACNEYIENCEIIDREEIGYGKMNEIADYINKNFSQPINLSTTARALGYDYYYFSRLFHSVFAISFSDYLSICRTDHASNLLITTDKSIIDIAFDCGFQSLRTFNEVFKKFRGVCPSQYRIQQKNR